MPRHKLSDPERFAVPSYMGGGTWIDNRGYAMEYAKGHPMSNRQGWVPQHRLIASEMLGRALLPTEHVHHKNGCKTDNRPENLEVLDKRDHLSLHASEVKIHLEFDEVAQAIREKGSVVAAAQHLGVCVPTLRNRFPGVARKTVIHPQPAHEKKKRSPYRLTEEQVREALQGRTTKEATEFLGIAPNGLHYKFGHLLNKRRSPGGTFPDDFVERVRALASDPNVGTRDAAGMLGTTPNTLRACYQKHGIEWISASPGRRKKSSHLASKGDA